MLQYDDIINKRYNEEQRIKLIKVANMLKNGTTKEEVQSALSCDERTARAYISACGYQLPLLSNASKKGYKIAIDSNDVTDNDIKVMERLSRVREELYSILPNIKFAHQQGYDYGNLENDIEKFLQALKKPRIVRNRL